MTDEAHLLLAAGEAAVAQPLLEVLSVDGREVTWVRTSRELRQQMADVPPDLLLLDLTLDIDGLEFLQSIRFSPDHPVAGVIALADSVAGRERALQLGAVAAVAKPVAADEVRRLVEELLAAS